VVGSTLCGPKSAGNGAKLAVSVLFVRFNSTQNTGGSETPVIAEEIKDSLPSFDQVDVNPVSDMTSDQIGYLDSIGMAQGWGPTAIVENILEMTHVYTGLPWWGTIVAATVGIRILMFPLYMKASANAAKTNKVKPLLDQALAEMKSAETPQEQYLAMANRKKIMKENDIHTVHQLFPVVQLPIAYGFFQALRKMANYPVDGFSTGGYAWFQDLTQVDPYLGLQCIAAAVVIGIVRSGGETGSSAMNKPMKKIMTILPLASILITKNFSAAVVLYFAVNSVISFVQTTILRNSAFRRLTNMPSNIPPQQVPGAPKGPETISEMFHLFTEKSKDSAIKQARKTNDKLEAIERRKASVKGNFIKRH